MVDLRQGHRSAFLNTRVNPSKPAIHAWLPAEAITFKDHVLHLNKSLYILKLAARDCQQMSIPRERPLLLHSERRSWKHHRIILLYLEDLLVCRPPQQLQAFIKFLRQQVHLEHINHHQVDHCIHLFGKEVICQHDGSIFL